MPRQIVKELNVIAYFLANYKYYGFINASRNGNSFDFILTRQDGKIIHAEVETVWQHYLDHKHHRNPKFDSVKLLILLASDDPPENKRHLLPPHILHIDLNHFALEPIRKCQQILALRE